MKKSTSRHSIVYWNLSGGRPSHAEMKLSFVVLHTQLHVLFHPMHAESNGNGTWMHGANIHVKIDESGGQINTLTCATIYTKLHDAATAPFQSDVKTDLANDKYLLQFIIGSVSAIKF